MQYRDLGASGLRVSRIGLGGEHLEGMPAAQAEAVVHAALEAGVNIIDCFMSQDEVRRNIGRALGARRRDVILQAHIGSARRDNQYFRTRDLDECKRFFEKYLTLMDTDYVGIAMVHYVDTQADFDLARRNGLFDYAHDLVRQGVAGAVGMSSHDPIVSRQAAREGLLNALMFSVNPAYDFLPGDIDVDSLFKPEVYQSREVFSIDPQREALYQTCEAVGVGITVMKALGGGMLLDAAASPLGRALTVAQCQHYALTRPAVASVLLGCRTPQEVAQAVAYETLADEERDFSQALSGLPKFSAKGRCMYCNHCLPCPQRINIAQVNKLSDLAARGKDIPATVRAHYEALEKHASDCVACRQCEARCPFGVEVARRMADTAERLGM